MVGYHVRGLELTENEMCQISAYYLTQITFEYLRENYSNLDDELLSIANEARERMSDNVSVEEDAILEAARHLCITLKKKEVNA